MTRPRLLMTADLLAKKRAETLTDTKFDGRWRTLLGAGSNALTATSREWLPTLAALSLLTDDPKWAKKAETIILSIPIGTALITLDRGKPVGAEVFQAAIAYDWLHDRLSPVAVSLLKSLLEAWGSWPWPETNPARKESDWGVSMPWDNYHYEFLRGSWLAGLALQGDSAVADNLIAVSKARWAKALAWQQEHQPKGVFAEGTNYSIGSCLSILQALGANKTAFGEPFPAWAGTILDAILQMTTPGMGGKAPFGDQASSYPAVHSDTDRIVAMLMATFGDRRDDAKQWLDSIVRNRSKRAESFYAEYLWYPS